MKPIQLFVISALFFSSTALPDEFSEPWSNSKNVLIIDPYYANSISWDKLATEPRVVAIIHKSTIGTKRLDPAYLERKKEAKKRGYLWGSYHWGVHGDPIKQADFYIDTVKPGPDELIALDLEDAHSKALMNVDEAILFLERVKAKIGRYPVLYTNHSSAKLISQKYKNSLFHNTPLWYARFTKQVNDFPKGVWETYTLWQFSSEIKQQLVVPGVKRDMDINVFNGDLQQLKEKWPFTRGDL